MGQPLHMPADDADFSRRGSQKAGLRADVFLRVDWQTLRRLPLSGAVAFNFKALFTSLTELRDEAYIPSLVLKVLNEGKESILRYKGTWHVARGACGEAGARRVRAFPGRAGAGGEAVECADAG